MRHHRVIVGAVLGLVAVVATARCTAKPEAPPAGATAAGTASELTPVLSVKELMEHVIDPTADWIFDAAVVDVSAKGVSETLPVSDEDWLKVERGIYIIAEASNLLKIPRPIAPPGTERPSAEPGKPPPELAPAEIQAMIDKDRALWDRHADDLRKVALESLQVVKARNVDGLLQIGSDIDKACEACHLEYWYPGDKPLVEADQKKKVTYDPPKK